MTVKKSQEEYVSQLLRTQYEVIGVYVNAHTKILHKHIPCGYEWLIPPHRILRSKSCPKCYGNIIKTTQQYIKELSNMEYEVLDKYINRYTKILHKHLVCGQEWLAIPHDILSGHGCPYCAGKNATKVYLLFIPELDLYKYGISNNPARRANELGYKCEVLEILEFNTHEEARQTEKELLKQVALTNTGLLKSGNSETFTAWL